VIIGGGPGGYVATIRASHALAFRESEAQPRSPS